MSKSRPARGGWIEMARPFFQCGDAGWSRPARGGWIEIILLMDENDPIVSRPARGGWIEISPFPGIARIILVPPRTGRVD